MAHGLNLARGWIFVSKVLLKQPRSFGYISPVLFLRYSGRVEQLQQRSCKDRGLQSIKYLLPGPLQNEFASAWSTAALSTAISLCCATLGEEFGLSEPQCAHGQAGACLLPVGRGGLAP